MKTTTQTLTLRRSAERGSADHGWLRSQHTFSFADYHDPAHMGFRALRVINEDHVAAGGGFPTHPHRDMEIFSYVVSGALRHEDSLGNAGTITPGRIQVMSAGTGVAHSEFNPSRTEEAHFLQIWIRPSQHGLAPRYTEWAPAPGTESAPKVCLISGDGREGSATIARDAVVYRLRPAEGTSHEVLPGRHVWIQAISGQLSVNGVTLQAGDGVSTSDPGVLEIVGTGEALLFDLD